MLVRTAASSSVQYTLTTDIVFIGQRSNNNALKQAAWNFINSATPQSVVAVGGSDVLNPINEVRVPLFFYFIYTRGVF